MTVVSQRTVARRSGTRATERSHDSWPYSAKRLLGWTIVIDAHLCWSMMACNYRNLKHGDNDFWSSSIFFLDIPCSSDTPLLDYFLPILLDLLVLQMRFGYTNNWFEMCALLAAAKRRSYLLLADDRWPWWVCGEFCLAVCKCIRSVSSSRPPTNLFLADSGPSMLNEPPPHTSLRMMNFFERSVNIVFKRGGLLIARRWCAFAS